MKTVFDRATETVGWLELAASPALAGAAAGTLAALVLGGPGGLAPGSSLALAGLAAGFALAESQRRATGTVAFLARLRAHPELNFPSMTLDQLNGLAPSLRAAELEKCCGSSEWVAALNQLFPFRDKAALLAAADHVWNGLTETDWREAFTHHPKIGDVAALREKFASTAAWAAGEQGAVQQADEATLQGLKAGNDEYEQKFGYIFIVCATGKSAAQMLHLLQARLPHSPYEEMRVAMAEQAKITNLRLEKLLA